jgi:hypothetical protein
VAIVLCRVAQRNGGVDPVALAASDRPSKHSIAPIVAVRAQPLPIVCVAATVPSVLS